MKLGLYTPAYLHMRPLVQGFNATERVNPDPGSDIDIRDTVLAASRAGEPVAISKSDVEHVVQSLRLVSVACSAWFSYSVRKLEKEKTTYV